MTCPSSLISCHYHPPLHPPASCSHLRALHLMLSDHVLVFHSQNPSWTLWRPTSRRNLPQLCLARLLSGASPCLTSGVSRLHVYTFYLVSAFLAQTHSFASEPAGPWYPLRLLFKLLWSVVVAPYTINNPKAHLFHMQAAELCYLLHQAEEPIPPLLNQYLLSTYLVSDTIVWILPPKCSQLSSSNRNARAYI